MPDIAGWPSSWTDLTKEQLCILLEGMNGHSLLDILNAWVPGEDAPYWNRKSPYVGALARAACALIESGLIEVWEEPVGVGEGGLMLRDLALEAVADHENWWRYDPDENWDPDEDLTRYARFADTNTEPMTTMYCLLTVREAVDRGLVQFPWWTAHDGTGGSGGE
jgi:hypothetical protein